MKFERGKDIKDTLMIGRKANATVVSGYYILGKVEYDDGWVSENMGCSTNHKEGTKEVLKYLAQGKRPKIIVIKKLFLDYLERRVKDKELDHPLTLDKDFNISSRIIILEFYLQTIGEYNNFTGNVYAAKYHEVKGKDLVFDDQLYVIPK